MVAAVASFSSVHRLPVGSPWRLCRTERSIPQKRGGVKYSYDYNLVPCISFRSSGEYEDSCLIYGMFGVGNNADDYAKELFKEFKKHFQEDVDEITAIAVMSDCDNTGIPVSGEFKDIFLSKN